MYHKDYRQPEHNLWQLHPRQCVIYRAMDYAFSNNVTVNWKLYRYGYVQIILKASSRGNYPQKYYQIWMMNQHDLTALQRCQRCRYTLEKHRKIELLKENICNSGNTQYSHQPYSSENKPKKSKKLWYHFRECS